MPLRRICSRWDCPQTSFGFQVAFKVSISTSISSKIRVNVSFSLPLRISTSIRFSASNSISKIFRVRLNAVY